MRLEDGAGRIPSEQREGTELRALLPHRSARSAGKGGSGLGLSIAMEIMKAHGGSLSAGASVLGGASFEAAFPPFRPGQPLRDRVADTDGEKRLFRRRSRMKRFLMSAALLARNACSRPPPPSPISPCPVSSPTSPSTSWPAGAPSRTKPTSLRAMTSTPTTAISSSSISP